MDPLEEFAAIHRKEAKALEKMKRKNVDVENLGIFEAFFKTRHSIGIEKDPHGMLRFKKRLRDHPH